MIKLSSICYVECSYYLDLTELDIRVLRAELLYHGFDVEDDKKFYCNVNSKWGKVSTEWKDEESGSRVYFDINIKKLRNHIMITASNLEAITEELHHYFLSEIRDCVQAWLKYS